MPNTVRKRCSRLACVSLTIAAAAVLAACGEADKPIKPLNLGSAPAASGTPIELERPSDPSGAIDFDRWPRACELLTDDEIKAVLPQATKVERESKHHETHVKQGIVASGRYASTRTVSAKDGECTFELDLPASGLRLSDLNPPKLNVYVDFAGTPKFVKQNFPFSDPKDSIEVAGGACYHRSVAYCVKGPLAFRISSQFAHQEKDFGDPDLEWRDRYQVDGRTITISSPGGDSPEANEAFKRQRQLEFDHIFVELAKVILRKI